MRLPNTKDDQPAIQARRAERRHRRGCGAGRRVRHQRFPRRAVPDELQRPQRANAPHLTDRWVVLSQRAQARPEDVAAKPRRRGDQALVVHRPAACRPPRHRRGDAPHM